MSIWCRSDCWLFRRAIRDDDDEHTSSLKKMLIVSGTCLFVLYAYATLHYRTTLGVGASFFPAPGFVGMVMILGDIYVNRRLNYLIVQVGLYLIGASLLLGDWIASMTISYPNWPSFMILLDVALVVNLPPRAAYNLIAMVTVWVILTSSEQAYRWGLFNVSIVPQSERLAVCDCATPPCALGITGGLSYFLASAVIFLLDFYFTRGFAYGMRREHDKMQKAIAATERIASSLSRFDLTSAEAVLSNSALPSPLHDAFKRILTNLEMYRPYLPDALFADLHSTVPTGKEVNPPGIASEHATLVFTDIQGSTRTWEVCPDAMRIAMALHNTAMRECLAEHGGYEVKTIGDAFMVAFESARSAVQFGLDVQKRLVETMWPEELLELDHCSKDTFGPWCGLRVRVGIHCGEVDVQLNRLTGRYDYFGNTVNKAARLESSCVGGAVAATDDVLEEAGDLGSTLVIGIGDTTLKNITEPVQVFLLLPVGLEQRREYVMSQFILRRNDRTPGVSIVGDTSSSTSSQRNPLVLENMQPIKCVATVSIVEVRTVLSVDGLLQEVNRVFGKVIVSAERTSGIIASLQGNRVVVCWNAPRACKTHVESPLCS